MIPGLAVTTLIGGAVLWGRVRPVDVPMVATWSGPVTVCGEPGIDPELLAEATRLWREQGHDISVGTKYCQIRVSPNPNLDDRASVRDKSYVRGRTSVDYTDGELTRAVVEVLPDSGLLTLCHELGHALGYLHARAAPSGHVLHPHRPSLDDWRGLAGPLQTHDAELPEPAEVAQVVR